MNIKERIEIVSDDISEDEFLDYINPLLKNELKDNESIDYKIEDNLLILFNFDLDRIKDEFINGPQSLIYFE